ncbi:pLS20_p028 family conjugation system transmembrane protein [Clostridium sporogenes]|uniref:pLS20_p028 family conjugation system transmembrane protein n=1 Tax=Clostridium sporogenes TaxID=1509 RepID=UPI001930EAE4|nr:hypothetical protein [Clostridium sporogenes]MCW6064743.1 hypothetical protein [Clostridium sporogenes]UCA39392.1 hypothetical protein LA363_19605 [Clostridium sporogenes]
MKKKLLKNIYSLKVLFTKEKKIKWISMVFLVFALLLVFNPIGVQASWFTDDKEVKSFLIKYQNELHFTKGGIGSIIGQMFTWTLIRGAYWICKTIQGLVPEALSIFDFVESTGISAVYTSIVNTIVVSLMVLTLIIIGFKMITQKNALDIKTVGMNIVVSVILILLMPTMITSGIKFSKVFYDDSTSITKSEGGIAWKMIEDGVTDLVYINKQKSYDKLGQNGQKKNALKEKDFFVYDLGEIITPDTAKDLEDDNKDAKFLQYKLSPDGEGNMVPVKIDSSWMALFSDSFKGGYYRYTKDTFSLVIGLIALAIAYLFSAFIIITAIIELSIKRVLGILVFATDLESGQRSKMVLSDIMQCFLTVGFQGFNMSIFAMFISFMGSGGGASVNPIIKTIAYVSSVFVLIKGSETIMRYFGVDIGVKEGFAQMATALGMSAMMLRGGKNIAGRFGCSNNNGDKDDRDTSNKPEKNFGNSIKDYANRIGHGVGYGMERGIDGLAADGANTVNKPVRSIRDAVKNTKKGFREGIDDGTVDAIKKGMDLKNANGKEDSIKEQPTNNLKNSINNSPLDRANNVRAVDPRTENGHNNSIRQQVDENIRRRNSNNTNGSEMDRSREEFIRQKYQNSNRNVEASTREQLINAKEKIQSNNGDSAIRKERILNAKENIQSNNGNSPTQRERLVNVKESIQPSGTSTTQREQIVNTRENIQSNNGNIAAQREQLVNVKENIQPSNGTSTIQREQIINTRENTQPSSGSKTIYKEQNVDIVENVKSNGLNNDNKQSVIVKEHVEQRKKFNLKGNSLFEDNSDKKNSLFDI